MTYITKMPDKVGAFLKASKIIASLGANIVRVSYNKAVDTHMLFIDVSGSPDQLARVSQKLESIGYLAKEEKSAKIMLLEFRLRDVPGAVVPILELIEQFNFNISYISSHESATDYQDFRMGIYVTDADKTKQFLDSASKLCDIKIVEYDKSKKVLDNTVFYLSFANQIASKLDLDRTRTLDLIADSNLIMQMLDERDEPPHRVFDRIGEFADLIKTYKGPGFYPKITKNTLCDGFSLYLIEPPCGSNTAILEKEGQLLFVDCGFACYEDEMKLVLSSLFSDFFKRRKALVITHPDVDHCGLTDMFDQIYVSEKSYENFVREQNHQPNFREQNEKHAPYCRISKILTNYTVKNTAPMIVVGNAEKRSKEPISFGGSFVFGGVQFDVYNGNGGHAVGEIVIVSEQLKLVFSGDIVVNIAGFTKQQYAFNTIAPYLMTSVNMSTPKASAERRCLLQKFDMEKYLYCCGHGALLQPDAGHGT